jgi:hypothetical protein
MMRTALAALSVVALTAPALAETCPGERAIYTQPESGYALHFYWGESWETSGAGMLTAMFRLVFPDGERVLKGRITGNMGTSRDVGWLEHGCREVGPDDAILTEEEMEACTVWRGLVYALGDHSADFVPFIEEPAARTLLLTDLGRTLRYSEFVSSPGEEPWDVFHLTGCAPE